VNWNAYDQVSTLKVPDDTHLIVTFHYYLPFEFTHQGAEWIGNESNAWLGKTWDGTDEEKAEVTLHFDSVATWADEHNVRILLGEFGAYSKAPADSRVRWTAFVAREAERHNFAWSYWEFASGFGMYDPAANIWRDDLLNALEKTVLKRKDLPPEIAINIGEPVTLSYEELQNQIGKLIHGEEWTTFEMPEPLAKAGAWTMNLFGDSFIKPWMIDRTNDHYELDITRAKKLLDWEPQHTLEDTVPEMIRKLKSDPLKWYKANKLEPPSALEKREEEKVS